MTGIHRDYVRPRCAASRWSGAVLALVLGLARVPAQSMVPDARGQGPSDPAGHAIGSAQAAPPSFRTDVDLIIFDAQVVAAEGQAVPRLTASQFEVKIAGRGRTIVMAEFLHADDGPIARRNGQPNVDAATRAACVFGFERVSNRAHAHYVLGVESTDRDRTKVEHPELKVLDRGVTLRRFSWRSRRPS